MKKVSCILLALILTLTALTACNYSNTPAVTTMETATATDTTAEPETETEAVTEEDINVIEKQEAELTAKQFLKYLKDKNVSKILKLIGANYDDKALEAKSLKAYSFIRDIDIKSYTITEKDSWGFFNSDTDMQYDVVLNISKSSNPLFPVGTSRWVLEAGDNDDVKCVTLFKHANTMINLILGNPRSEIVNFCYRFSKGFGCFETISDFNSMVPSSKDKHAFNEFCFQLCFMLPFNGNNRISRKRMESQAKINLGLTGIDFKKCFYYEADEDVLDFGGKGGNWYFCALASDQFDPATKQHTIIIDYYSDTAFILKAKTIKYTVRENKDESFTLLSTELVYDSGVPIAGGSD